jgi:hypothetical protein
MIEVSAQFDKCWRIKKEIARYKEEEQKRENIDHLALLD